MSHTTIKDGEVLVRLTIMVPEPYKEALDKLKSRGYNPSEIARIALSKELRLRQVLREGA